MGKRVFIERKGKLEIHENQLLKENLFEFYPLGMMFVIKHHSKD